MQPTHMPFVLIILDGFGYRENPQYNAISSANMPCWDALWRDYPHALISGSGTGVGLPDGQMGNSEVGHLNIGAGRIVYQEFTRIEHAIDTGEFFTNPIFVNALQQAKNAGKAVHIMGLLSPGGVHSHERQLLAIVDMAAKQQLEKIYVHAFLDGRDTPPKSAMTSLTMLNKELNLLGRGQIASIIGRYYAMDRDKRWERIERAYDLIVDGKADYQATTAVEALELAYARGETDEFVQPTAIHAPLQKPITVADGDVVIFMNYRADRARQLTRAFTEENFTGFKRHRVPKLAEFVTLTHYADDIKASVAYPPQTLNNVLGEYIAKLGLKQLRIAETEKYAHVTFFFNGGVETPFNGEDRILIPSPKVATYDLQPEMSAVALTDRLVEAIESKQYALIVCNFANPDMVGHTGDFAATVKAIECIDKCLARITIALQHVGGEAIITADHGNAECMYDETTKQPHTAHTNDPVPLIYIGRKAKVNDVSGALSDIAPTILYLLDLSIPTEMQGKKLFTLCNG